MYTCAISLWHLLPQWRHTSYKGWVFTGVHKFTVQNVDRWKRKWLANNHAHQTQKNYLKSQKLAKEDLLFKQKWKKEQKWAASIHSLIGINFRPNLWAAEIKSSSLNFWKCQLRLKQSTWNCIKQASCELWIPRERKNYKSLIKKFMLKKTQTVNA